MSDMPVHCNVLWQRRDAARNCPKGEIELAFCPVCSFITNLKFEPRRLQYTHGYENPLEFSARFQAYSKSLATRLVKRYDLHNKSIIEIGSGKGYFLTLLCKLGNNQGVGFDPTYVEQATGAKTRDQVRFIQDFYSERYRNHHGDLIACRQTLEHVANPKGFLEMLRQAIENQLNTVVFFEVPNALQTFDRLFIWDIIYEHCSYFTAPSLSITFSLSGFRVCELGTEYESQFLCIYALPSIGRSNQDPASSRNEKADEIKRIESSIASFATRYQTKVKECRQKLERMEDRAQRIVVWGAGSKGVTFLNTFKKSGIEFVVDINPSKQGNYIPGTGQQIVPPAFLRKYQPDVIIAMNPIYGREIRRLVNKLGLAPKFVYA